MTTPISLYFLIRFIIALIFGFGGIQLIIWGINNKHTYQRHTFWKPHHNDPIPVDQDVNKRILAYIVGTSLIWWAIIIGISTDG